MPKKNVSIWDVSQKSGVSIATVSRILNQTGRFSKETEARVYKVMQELDYVPSKLARSMRTQQNSAIGILVPDILNESYALMTRTIQLQLMREGYITTIFNTEDNLEVTHKCIEMVRAQQLAGMIYIPDRRMADFSGDHIPTVFLERQPRHAVLSDIALVEADNEQAGYLAATELLNEGCKRLGVLMDEEDLSSHCQRLTGVKRALAERGLALEDSCVYRMNSQKTTQAIAVLEEAYSQHSLPDGLFAMELRLSIGALKVLGDHCLDTKLVGFGKMRLADYGLFDFNTIIEPAEDMAAVAAQTILSMVQGEVAPPVHQVLPVRLHKADTAG